MPENYEVKVRPEKVAEVEHIRDELGSTPTVLLTEYRGLTVNELKDLRAQLLRLEASYKVIKNTLARRAASEAGLGELEELFVGPTAVAWVRGDPVGAAKVIATFAKDHPALVVKGGVLDGRVMTAEETQGLATVDALDVSRAKIVGLLTAALQQIVFTLEAPIQRMMYVLQQIGERGGEQAEASTEDAPSAEGQAPAAEAEAPSAEADATPAESESAEAATDEASPGEPSQAAATEAEGEAPQASTETEGDSDGQG
jgi:large subunit ribosomal protein L10